MASIKSDPKLTEADKAIRRINTDLKRAASLFGVQSSQYGQLETYTSKLLEQAGYAGDIRHVTASDGTVYVQIPRTRSLLESVTNPTSKKMIDKIERAADYKKQEKWMIERYKEEHGGKLPAKGAAGRRAAVQDISSLHRQLNDTLSQYLDILYDLREVTGNDDAVEQVRMLSRGQWTTAASKEEMIRIAQEAIAEQRSIIEDYWGDAGLDSGMLD